VVGCIYDPEGIREYFGKFGHLGGKATAKAHPRAAQGQREQDCSSTLRETTEGGKTMKRILLAGLLTAIGCSTCHAQAKQACELVTKADAESVLGVTLEQPRPYAPFRSLLDKDFTKGMMGAGCTFTNVAPGKPRPPKVIEVGIEVRYSPTPNNAAVEQLRKEIDERTYEDPVEVPGLGDAAVWLGPANNLSLFVFTGGKMTLMIGPSQLDLKQAKALALKALGGPGKTGYVYGTRIPLNKPLLTKLGANPSQIDQLKHDLAAKAEAGDANAQLALGSLYQFGERGSDGNPKPDYAGAAYWYQQASDHGKAWASYELAVLFRRGLGVPENQRTAHELFKKAALAGYVPAMAPLAFLYEDANTPTSQHREIHWAVEAAQKGDPDGLLMRGYLYNKGWLGGDPAYYYPLAMTDYRKAAAGGSCVAMMDIGGLYFNGNGVPQDRMQAQDWFARAEACSGPGLKWVKEKSAKFREKAAAGRLPAVSQEATKLAAGQKLAMGLLVTMAIAFAVEAARRPSKEPSGDVDNSGVQQELDFLREQRILEACPHTGQAMISSSPGLGCW